MIIENNRLYFLDALKGFAIFLVVAGHWMIRLGLGSYENVLWTFIVSLHLPLFFFVSGYLSEGKSIEINTLVKKAKLLLIPGAIFFTLYMISRDSSPLSFIKYGFQEYWFTFVLFEMFFIHFICTHCFKKYGFINFSIFEDGEEIDLSQYTATFFFKFPSKKIESMGGEITNNMVVLPLSDDFFNEKGDTTFEIAFTGKKQKVTTFKMYLRV